jgi:predicted xylose isomerase-like sugar epimerase
MIETKPKRRWFRFSLRMLLLVVTVLCVWLGFNVNAARRQKEAVQAIRLAGGSVWFEYHNYCVAGLVI